MWCCCIRILKLNYVDRGWSVSHRSDFSLACGGDPRFSNYLGGVCFSKYACSVSFLLALRLHSFSILIPSWLSRLILAAVRWLPPCLYNLEDWLSLIYLVLFMWRIYVAGFDFRRFRLQTTKIHVLFLRDLKLILNQPALFTMGGFCFLLSSSRAVWSLGCMLLRNFRPCFCFLQALVWFLVSKSSFITSRDWISSTGYGLRGFMWTRRLWVWSCVWLKVLCSCVFV